MIEINEAYVNFDYLRDNGYRLRLQMMVKLVKFSPRNLEHTLFVRNYIHTK